MASPLPSSSILSSYTPEMYSYYLTRTCEHIERVKQNMIRMVGYYDLTRDELETRGGQHDYSKLNDDHEKLPYIWLSWYHKMRQEGAHDWNYPSEDIRLEVKKAIDHHIHGNRHHPEFHVDLNQMTNLDLVEMVCDMTAMAQELKQNNGSARIYVEEQLNRSPPKWFFNDATKKKLFDTIREVDQRIEKATRKN